MQKNAEELKEESDSENSENEINGERPKASQEYFNEQSFGEIQEADELQKSEVMFDAAPLTGRRLTTDGPADEPGTNKQKDPMI